jgi:hypothetical protein
MSICSHLQKGYLAAEGCHKTLKVLLATDPLTYVTNAASVVATGFEVQSLPLVMHSLKTTMLL